MLTRDLTTVVARYFKSGLMGLALISLGAALVVLTPGAPRAFAQDEDADDAEATEDEVETFAEIRELPGADIGKIKSSRTKFTTILRAGKAADAAEEKIVDDYTNYLVAELTWKENRSELPQKRDELRKRYLIPAGDASAPDMHDRVNRKLLDVLPKLAANENYHPAVRVNAMLIVADLNQQERKFNVEAQPMPEAFSVLLTTAMDANSHAAIRAAAMYGLTRHASGNLSGDARKNLVSALVELIKDPAAAGSGDGGLWLRMTAARVLAMVSPSPDTSTPDVGAALIEMAGQANAKLPVRCEAAYSLGHLDAKAFASDKVLPGARQLAELSVALTRLATSLAPAEGTNGEASPVGAKVKAAVATELQYGLTGVRQALVGSGANLGLRSAADEAAKQFIDGLVGQIDPILTICGDSKLAPPEFAAEVRAKSQELESWLGDNGAGQPAAAAAAAPKARGAKARGAGAAEAAAP